MIVFIRHGETEYNAKGLWMGLTDEPLNKNGLVQAHLAAEQLKALAFSRIYTSPLKRAYETACIIHNKQSTNPELIVEKSFQERAFGNFEGLTKTATRRKKLEEAYGVESMLDLQSRLLLAMSKIKTLENTLIVSHSAVFRCLVENLGFSVESKKNSLSNCEFAILTAPEMADNT
ncbi:histidine phosphatase family protein [Pseudomonas frederiksbergensis]|nr:histidine phosphatase family protein [Pseudomonas frederiksbergensis]